MKCSICGSSTKPLTFFIHAETLETDFVCSDCQARSEITKMTELEELDYLLGEYEAVAAKYESLIREMPEMPEATDAFSHTPLTTYKSVQSAIALIKSHRMELIAKSESKDRLEYELKKSIEVEDFERAAEIRKKLEELSDKE